MDKIKTGRIVARRCRKLLADGERSKAHVVLGAGDRYSGKIERVHGAQPYCVYGEHRTRPRCSQNAEIQALVISGTPY